MKLRWYINRLRSMEPAEILHRIEEKRRRWISRRRDQGWRRYPARGLHPVFPELAARIRSANAPQRAAIAEGAEAILAGKFSALGRAWPQRDPSDLFPPELWRIDPVTGGSWPDAGFYCFDIDFRHDGRRGDVKYVWEINRLQMLPPLAAQFLLTGDRRCLAAIEAAIDSWHAANPPFGGVGWTSGIEVALRSISIVLVLALAGDAIGEDTWRKAGEILAASAFWLERFPSRFSSANNHLVAELVGEYLLARAFGHDTEPLMQAIAAEAEKQILEDGVPAEQSPTYGAFTVELILFAALSARQSGAAVPDIVGRRLAAFADFVGWLGTDLPGFGDDDEGRVVTLGNETAYPASVAACVNAFLTRPGTPVGRDALRAAIFGEPDGLSGPAEGRRTFPAGGLSIWRGTVGAHRVALGFDHGPLGYLSIAAHGHADALALTLAINGKPVLTDPGTYLYGSGGVWRDWFRSTPAHNTLNIASESQSLMAGPFNWRRKAHARLVETGDKPSLLFRGRHDGYRERLGCEHERAISVRDDGFLIHDRLIGGTHLCQIVFQLADDLTATVDHAEVIVRRGGDRLLTLHFPDGGTQVGRGGEMPGRGGWVSRRFGTRSPADRIAWEGQVGEDGVTVALVLA